MNSRSESPDEKNIPSFFLINQCGKGYSNVCCSKTRSLRSKLSLSRSKITIDLKLRADPARKWGENSSVPPHSDIKMRRRRRTRVAIGIFASCDFNLWLGSVSSALKIRLHSIKLHQLLQLLLPATDGILIPWDWKSKRERVCHF